MNMIVKFISFVIFMISFYFLAYFVGDRVAAIITRMKGTKEKK